MTDLKTKALNGVFWSFNAHLGKWITQSLISIILARLLMPSDFGLIAMLTFFISISQTIVEGRLGSALIQKQNINRKDESTVFFFNLITGLIFTALLWMSAPWIAKFYNTPKLTILTRVLSFNFIINALGFVQYSLLLKKIDLKTLTKITIISNTASGLIGIIFAYKGLGVWALVAQSLSSSIFNTTFLWTFSSWRPLFIFDYASFKRMFTFSSNLLISALIYSIFQNIYSMVIGKLFSPTQLGFYSRAYTLTNIPVSLFSKTVTQVTYPIYSSIQDEKLRLKRGVSQSLKAISSIHFPFMIGLAACAEPLVKVLLTDKWLPSVPYAQLLCFVGLLYPLHSVNLNVLTAQGRSDLFLKLEIIKMAIIALAIFITYRGGITVMIYGQIGTSLIGYFVNSYYTSKFINYPITEQVKDLLPSLVLSSVIGTILLGLTRIPFKDHFILLFIQVVTGISLYIILIRFLNLPSYNLIPLLKTNFQKAKLIKG